MGLVLQRILFSTIALVFATHTTYQHWERRHFIAALPAQLETAGKINISGQAGLTEGCGIAVFRLSPKTRNEMEAQGLQYLQDTKQARGYDSGYYAYESWQATPIEKVLADQVESPEMTTLTLGMSCS